MIKDLLIRQAIVKKIVLGNLSERMPDNQLKAVLGGYYSEGNTGSCCVWGDFDLGNGQTLPYCTCGVGAEYVVQALFDCIGNCGFGCPMDKCPYPDLL